MYTSGKSNANVAISFNSLLKERFYRYAKNAYWYARMVQYWHIDAADKFASKMHIARVTAANAILFSIWGWALATFVQAISHTLKNRKKPFIFFYGVFAILWCYSLYKTAAHLHGFIHLLPEAWFFGCGISVLYITTELPNSLEGQTWASAASQQQ